MPDHMPALAIGAGTAVTAFLLGVGLTTARLGRQPKPLQPVAVVPAVPVQPFAAVSAEAPVGPQVLVHVAGQVKQPGLYRLSAGARVQDVLRAAGGATPKARLNDLNLAATVRDGLRLYVPAKGEATEQVVVTTEDIWVHDPPRQTPGPTLASPRTVVHAGAVRAKAKSVEKKPKPTGRIDLNRATSTELQALPGIGPALAGRIIAYRSSVGPFKQPVDLKKVRGIGDKTYAKLAPYLATP